MIARPRISSLVADEVEVHLPSAEGRAIRIEVDAGEHPILVDVDPERVRRVVMNVLTNAIKFSTDGERIDVLVTCTGTEAQISVKDVGPGIAADSLESVFEQFAQLGEQKRGHGLGLFIARTIVDAHGGRIWVDSVPWHGATFHIGLPASPHA